MFTIDKHYKHTAISVYIVPYFLEVREMELEFEKRSECRSMRVEECAATLGIGKSAMYKIVNEAAKNGGKPFAVMKTKGKLLVSRKSFFNYLESQGF